jgi:hypothetical protein
MLRFIQPHALLPLDSSLLFCSTNQHHQTQLATCCLSRLSGTPKHYIFTLKMATEIFAETLDSSQHLTQLIPKS